MNIRTTILSLGLMLTGTLHGCSTASPSWSEANSAQQSGDASRARFERQCINSGVKPGSPALVKCVDDLLDINSE